MARPIEFDVDRALDAAMEAFWVNGYDATSTEQLVTALGINRSSLYNSFGSKRELYLAALARYEGATAAIIAQTLRGPGPLAPRVRAALLRAAFGPGDGPPRGCFAGNTAAELGTGDREAAKLTARTFAGLRAAFRDELVLAAERGELPAGTNVRDLAGTFVALMQGVQLLAKGGASRREVAQAIDGLLWA